MPTTPAPSAACSGGSQEPQVSPGCRWASTEWVQHTSGMKTLGPEHQQARQRCHFCERERERAVNQAPCRAPRASL